MYLKYFQIVNYKNIKSGKLVFDKGANTIVGENDAGKTNAMYAIRMLLDDYYYYSSKRLKESDFADVLGDWRGHWIIMSAVFDDMTGVDTANEVGAELQVSEEDKAFANAYIKSGNTNLGIVTLFIRPKKAIRKKLYEAIGEEFDNIRASIKTSDYEFIYTSRSQIDFTDEANYKKIVGDIENKNYANPDDEDMQLLGAKIDITGFWEHISVVFIDALRDVEAELHKTRNPIRRIIENLEDQIDPTDIDKIKDEIDKLNLTVSEVKQISNIGKRMNQKLNDMLGEVYSPDLILKSQLNEDITSLARFLALTPNNQNGIELLGLGHLNMIYMALKIVEFEMNKNHELLNIMIVEEPEAHIHTHIQRTLFENFKKDTNYTQVIMTTHSTHLSEVSQIKSVNIFKSILSQTTIMQPINGLDVFGKDVLELKKFKLSECIERYLDAKRTVLLFSKGVVLVEGDGEEILIPQMVKMAFGVTLDEMGIGLINVGSTAFEYVASLFAEERIKRYCAIITDLDVQAVDSGSTHYKAKAAKKGEERKEKLDTLYSDNEWVNTYYAPNTFEVDFAKEKSNQVIIKRVVEEYYENDATIKGHKDAIDGDDILRAETLLTMAGTIGKGWFATMIANELDITVMIPEYILEALAFASRETLTIDLRLKIVHYSVGGYDDSNKEQFIEAYKKISTLEDKKQYINNFQEEYPNDVVTKFFNIIEYNDIWEWI